MANLSLNNASANFSVAPFTPDKAINGSLVAFDRWVGTVPGWFMVDLGYTYWINGWTIKNPGIISQWGDSYNMIDYALQASNDGEIWKNVYYVDNNEDIETTITFNPYRSRYFRTYIDKGLKKNNAVASISAFELNEYDNSPYLDSLQLSTGTLDPVFNKHVFEYAVKVPSNVSSIYVTPVTSATNADVTVNGHNVNLSKTQNITLSNTEASTVISIEVAIIGTDIKETYTVTVSKDIISPYLSDLRVNEASSMSPEFRSDIDYYNVYVTDVYRITITPVTETPNATVYLRNGMESDKVVSGHASKEFDVAYGTTTQILASVEGAMSYSYTIRITVLL